MSVLLRGFVLALIAFTALAQENPASAVVEFDQRTLFHVFAPLGRNSPQDRATLIREHLKEFAQDSITPVEALRLVDSAGTTEIHAGRHYLLAVTEQDAAAAGRPRALLVSEYMTAIRDSVAQYREDRSWRSLLRGSGMALLVSLLFAGILVVLWRVHSRLRNRLLGLLRTHPQGIRFHATQLLTTRQIVHTLITLSIAARWFVVLVFVQIYIPVVLGFFPGTVRLAHVLTDWIWAPFRYMGASALAYFPNLLYVIAIGFVVFYAIRLSDFTFREIAAGRIRFESFHVDWADPTSKLARLVILAAGLVAVFPYLPGSDSPAFKSISIFFGVLFSLGSTSAVANMVAGIIITYMRPFQIGDRVRISDTTGDVLEKNLLVTRIQTIKNVVVTIPNGNILNAQILNFTAPARENRLILHTSVTIGYDTPWRKVHELLINAASKTEHILHEPAPFVLQTALNDFYVSYEINAYTAEASKMVSIYAELHQNIQDQFNEAGMEIMSPHYTALREGNSIAIPENYRPDAYRAPRFRVEARKVEESS